MTLNKELYRKLYLIRKSEELICDHYFDDEMKTPMHMSKGGEAISVGVCHALGKGNQFFGTYRSHALYLAITENTDDFFAEMYGKGTSLQKGKSGSMHLADPRAGLMATSAIVGTSIPVALGAAFALKKKEPKNFAVVFFGDGATDTGVFWESLNVACLMNLPILFICEDNDLAVHTPKSARNGYKSIIDIVSKFNCLTFSSQSTDAEEIYQLTRDVMKQQKIGNMPCFIHLKYYRYLEHVGVSPDFHDSYRSQDEYNEWKSKDPINLQREKLIQLIGLSEVLKIESELDQKAQTSLEKAQLAPFPPDREIYQDIFA